MEILCYVLYNTFSDKKSKKELGEWLETFTGMYGVELICMDDKGDIGGFLRWIDPYAELLILGDDETAFKFLNAARSTKLLNRVTYYPVGEKRDFYISVAGGDYGIAVDISDCIKDCGEIHFGYKAKQLSRIYGEGKGKTQSSTVTSQETEVG